MSLSNSINSTRRYGSTTTRSVMLTVIDSELFMHNVEPSDTLQGLAIKYGVSVEKLKRVNRLWSNDAMHIKDKLVIPCSGSNDYERTVEPYSRKEDFLEQSKKSNSKHLTSSYKDECDGQFSSSWKENEGQLANQISGDSNSSEAFKSLNQILSKIDGQIQVHKNKHHLPSSLANVPPIGYDSYHELTLSPTRQYPSLEEDL